MTITHRQLSLGAVNMQAQDPTALAAFWALATGTTPSPIGASVYLPAAGPDGFALFVQPLTGPRPDHQMTHLDLTVPWGTRQAEVERLLDLGAVHRWDEWRPPRWCATGSVTGEASCRAATA